MFTDIVMPGINRRKLADKAHKRRQKTDVLLTISYTRNALVHKGVLNPGVDLLTDRAG